jgi:Domain of unknown function (DUF4124)
MKTVVAPTVLVALSLLASVSAWAEIYKYVDPVTGAVEYTNQPKKGAVRMNTGDTLSEIPTGNRAGKATAVKVSTTTNLSSGSAIASVDAGTQKTRDGTRRQVLADELASEEKMLNEARSNFNNGKPLPLADEGIGSPKYIDRSKQIEKTLRHHERNVASLKKELDNLKL